MEIKLTQVARASLEELKLDYEDFLRQRGLAMLEPKHPALLRFKDRQCQTLEEVQDWVLCEKREEMDWHGQTRTTATTAMPTTATTAMPTTATTATTAT